MERDNTRIQRILELTARVLAEGRGRTMQEIADISGVGRTTLYRHFRTRDELIQAIRAQALDEVYAAILASRLEDGDADEALRRLIPGLVNVGDRYRILVYEGLFDYDETAEAEQRIAGPLYALVERGQREGVFDASLSARWILTAMANLVLAAIHQVQIGEMARNHAAPIIADTLLRGVRAPGRD